MRILLFVVFYFRGISSLKWCSKIDNCRCATDEGVINLWSLQSDRPRFNVSGKSEASNGRLSYIWSPCFPWTFKPSGTFQVEAAIRNCTNVAVCRIEEFPVIGPVSTDIGEQEMMSCKLSTNTAQPSCVLEYGITHEEDHKTHTNIMLHCDVKHKAILDPFSVLFDHSLYTTTLHSVCACPGRCNNYGALPQTISIGFLIIIIFVCCGVIYIIGGMIFNGIGKRARGKKMIPNLSFWMDLPYLIKDGVIFSKHFCYSCFKTKNSYNSI